MMRESDAAGERGRAQAGNGIPPADVRSWDNAHVVHPWDKLAGPDADRTVVQSAEGVYLVDPEGRRYLDGPGGMWCVQVGYGRREIADAMAEQAMRLAYTSPWYFATEPSARLARKIADIAPGDLDRVFFATGGSTAVDSAVRFVHFYHNVLGRPEKKIVLSRERSYHGSTYLAATVTGKERELSHLDTARELVRFLPDVNPALRGSGVSEAEWAGRKAQDLEDAILALGPDRVGAFIAEPVLASGGVVIPPAGYHRATLEVCRRHEVLYISDEVVTGFGRLGHWFASEEVFGIQPDILLCAKGLTSGYVPLGATVLSARLAERIEAAGGGEALFGNGFTYSGHPVACAAALANIDIIEREGILEHVQQVAPLFRERLLALGQRHEIVRDARGIGLLGALEGSVAPEVAEDDRLEIDREFGSRMDRACEARGLMVRPLVNMCVFSPPLVIQAPEIERMFDILDEALGEVGPSMLREWERRAS